MGSARNSVKTGHRSVASVVAAKHRARVLSLSFSMNHKLERMTQILKSMAVLLVLAAHPIPGSARITVLFPRSVMAFKHLISIFLDGVSPPFSENRPPFSRQLGSGQASSAGVLPFIINEPHDGTNDSNTSIHGGVAGFSGASDPVEC